MALPILPTVFRCAISHAFGAGGVAATNVIHVSSATLTPSQVLTALNGAAAVGMFDATTLDLSAHSAVVTKLDGATPSIEGALASPAWTGTGAAGGSPASAAVITLKTTQRGRRHTGRVYIPWIGEDKMGSGSLDAASAATMTAAWTTFIANCITAGIPLHVTSYGFDGVAPPPKPVRPAFAATTVQVETASAGASLGTQRRRQSRLRS